MSKAFATAGLSAFEAAVLRALVDLDSFHRIPGGAWFSVRAVQRRSGQHELKGNLWTRWLDLVRDGLVEKTGDAHIFKLNDLYRITPKGREALAAHEAMP